MRAAFAAFAAVLAAQGAVTYRWPVETTRVQNPVVKVYRGEKIALQAVFTEYSKPVDFGVSEARFFWQTNGMGQTWWEAPASIASNVVTAVFEPSFDVGAGSYRCFIGVPGENWRANCTLSMLPSPGFTPNALELPALALDFAAVDWRNAPWLLPDATNGLASAQSAAQAAQNTADAANAYATSAISDAQMALSHAWESGNPHNATAEDVGAWPASEGAAVWAYLTDKSFRVVVTNYDSAVRASTVYFEAQTAEGGAWREVWNETNALNATIEAAVEKAHATANHAWGAFDSQTGQPSPDGLVQVSAEGGMLVGGGMRWSQVKTSPGSYWVLTSTDPTICATGTNGVFSIRDADGADAITIVKGDKRLVPAVADAVEVVGETLQVRYSVAAAEHPRVEMATDLAAGPWYAEGDAEAPFAVAWSGSSGNWLMTAETAGRPVGFFRATYETGGETYVKMASPGGIGLEKIRIGTVTYAVGTATISGHTVLTLTPETRR